MTRRVPYDETYLNASYEWLRDPEMAYLTMSAAVTREQQRAWYDGLPGRTDYAIWGIEHDGRPVGVMGLKGIEPTTAEYFLYLGDKGSWGQGLGRWAFEEIVRVGRERGLATLTGLVGAHNERSLAVHEHLGFRRIGVHDDGRILLAYEL